MAVTFFFLVLTLIWGPPKIILPRAPQSVRPGLTAWSLYHCYNGNFLENIKTHHGIFPPLLIEHYESFFSFIFHHRSIVLQFLPAVFLLTNKWTLCCCWYRQSKVFDQREVSVHLSIGGVNHQYFPYCGKLESSSVDSSYTFSCTMDPSLRKAIMTVIG